MMQAMDIIAKTRDKQPLTSEEIKFWVAGYTKGDIPDYQVSAWCMAVLLNGLTKAEVTDLTLHMAHSGDTLDLMSIAPLILDKHSTGGVGDKTTLAVAPLVAATGLPVGKMSGRGLGFSGGTVDKLEAIAGFRTSLMPADFIEQLQQHNIVVSGQSADLAPADGKFYALRDVTGTVPSLPLIASSIMSKKIAAGATTIVLDVKVGQGAFIKTLDEAEVLAALMVEIGQDVGKQVAAILSAMNQPLGNAVGNALEVKEVIEILQDGGPTDLRSHCLTVAGKMIQLGGLANTLDEAKKIAADHLADGGAWAKFVEWITAQGGEQSQLEDPTRLPTAPCIETIFAPQSAYIAAIDAAAVGWTVVEMGGGRRQKGDLIDHRVGLVHQAKVGDWVNRGDPLFTLHAGNVEDLSSAKDRVLKAITWSDKIGPESPAVLKIIG